MTATDLVLWALLVLVSVGFFAFVGGYLGALSAPARPTREGPDVPPVTGGVETIVERR